MAHRRDLSDRGRLLLGPHAVREALTVRSATVAVVYADAREGRALGPLERLARERGVAVEGRSRDELDALSGGDRHQGIVGIAGDYRYCELEDLLERARPCPLLLALDQVQDPHNFGAMVRSAVAFGVDGILTLRHRAAPVSAAVVRVSAGATERARIARVGNLAQTLVALRERELQVVGLSGDAEHDLDTLPAPPAGRVLVVGSEGRGLRRLTAERCDLLARLPLASGFESLNASVAAALAIYESTRARRETLAHQDGRADDGR
ncbi:MAG: 23S rRNA (guanosine(2251)-2'-O)-methyltransferase RlmB [Myxococcales bacterium]|nr:23S rRNA (guanosine(2251)-2'-O)-methyltransferase RlmB [Myxococcales bacterium]